MVYTESGVQPVVELYEMPPQPLVEIELENGLRNIATPSQLFRVLNPDLSFSWEEAEELKSGDRIVLKADYPDVPAPPVLAPFNGEEKVLNCRIAYLLGLLMSDGRVAEREIVERIAELLRVEFGCEATIEINKYIHRSASDKKLYRQGYTLRINRDELNAYFVENFYLAEPDTPTKHIPSQVLRAPKDTVLAFLSGLMDGDGSVHRERNVIHYGSVSARLIEELQVLLHHLGIPSRRYVKESDGAGEQTFHCLEVAGAAAQRLAEELDLAHPIKRRLLARMKRSVTKQLQDDHITFAQVVRVSSHEPEKTYDLQVAEDHMFVANGMVVHNCLGKYHPHGEAAVYDTIVRMAQDFSMRYPLIDGQGNFGSVDGDAAAAMRYTEARLSPIAEEMLSDIGKDTVDFFPNFDESLMEPAVLPAKLPNLLVNGASGIAVGMATNIPPHNLGEIVDGLLILIDNPKATVKDLMEAIKGPDFPTGAIISGADPILKAYTTGRGQITLRARVGKETDRKGREYIVVKELPYQVNKARLIESIADYINKGKIEGIADLRDESDREGMRIVIEVKRGYNPDIIVNQLYQHTQMQVTFGIIMLALVNNQPRVMGLKEMLSHYLEHRNEVIIRRTKFDLNRTEKRAHILKGLLVALSNLDKVIAAIRRSKDAGEARDHLVKDFKLSPAQAQAILEMRLHRLTALERDRVVEEYKGCLNTIKELKDILASNKRVLEIIRGELVELKERYGDPRRTEIQREKPESFTVEDLTPKEKVVITLTRGGYINRVPTKAYSKQGRGGRGIIGAVARDDDSVRDLFVATTHDYILFLTRGGNLYWLKAYEVPEGSRTGKGKALANLLRIPGAEIVTATLPIEDFVGGRYLVMVTKNGTIKRTELSEFGSQNGMMAIKLVEGDELVDVQLSDGKGDVMLVTARGMAIRFPQDDVRPMGRAAQGVRGISLGEGDSVVSMIFPDDRKSLLVVTSDGYGKRVRMKEFRRQGRGGRGLICVRGSQAVAGAIVVENKDEFIAMNSSGNIIRLEANSVKIMGRNSRGIKIMNLVKGENIVSIARATVD
ncbi:MAG: DNA gyrase subunit A [bacterium]